MAVGMPQAVPRRLASLGDLWQWKQIALRRLRQLLNVHQGQRSLELGQQAINSLFACTLRLLYLCVCSNATERTRAGRSQELSGCGERWGDHPGTRHRPLEVRTPEEIDAVCCQDIGAVGRPQNRYCANRECFSFCLSR